MLDYWRRLAADEECGGGGLRVNVAYKHAGRIHSKNGFICGTAWRSLHTNLFLYSKHRNGAVCSFFFFCWSIFCVSRSRECAVVSASPAPKAEARNQHAGPYLPPLPCVRPSRCNRAASTSFTRGAPGESQLPLLDG